MTTRQRLSRRLCPLVISLYGGLALVLASGLLGILMKKSPAADYFLVPTVIGIVVTMVSGLVIQFGIRCPVCRLRLSPLLFATGHVWRFGKHFNFCPKCGTSLDQEVAT